MHNVRAMLGALGKFRWAFPLFLLLVGYAIPALRVPIGWPDSNTLWALLFASLVLVVIWLGSEIIAVVYRYTTSRELQWDDFISLCVALTVTYIAGWRRGGMEWWLVFPWIGAVADAILSGFLAINNAAQKPFFPEKDQPRFPPR